MLRQRDAPGDGPGAAHRQNAATGRKCLVMPYDTTGADDLSNLLDQAVTLAEKHEAQAWRSWRLAQKHRRIKAALEELAEVKT